MQYAFGPLSALDNVRSFGTMERKIRFAAILLAFAATGGCGWTTGAPGPMDTQRRASPVAEVTDGGPPTGELFLTDAPLRFVLEADFSLLEGDRSQESEAEMNPCSREPRVPKRVYKEAHASFRVTGQEPSQQGLDHAPGSCTSSLIAAVLVSNNSASSSRPRCRSVSAIRSTTTSRSGCVP